MHAMRLGVVVMTLLSPLLASADDRDEPSEVIEVRAREPEPTELTLSAGQLREVPGSLGDPIRALSALPGIVPTNANRPEVYMRGAPPANTGLFIDGVRVPLLFHGGVLSSVIPGALVDTVDVFESVVPARYGGVAGGAIEIETVSPATSLHADARLSAYEGGGLVETPLDDGRGSLLAAARVGDPGLLIALLSGDDTRLFYWDYQARATWRVADHDRVSVFAFGSHDRLGETEPGDAPGEPETFVDELDSDFHRVDLRYDHATSSATVRAAVTGGWTKQGARDLSVHDLSFGARIDGELVVDPRLRARAGFRIDRDAYTLRGVDDSPDPASIVPPPRNTTTGGYTDLVWDATDRVQLVPGIRVDLFDSTRALDGASGTLPAIQPRFAARWRVRPDLALVASAAMSDQLSLLRVGSAPSTAIVVPGLWANTHELQRARQTSAGVEWLLPDGIVGTATGYGSITYGLTDLPRTCQRVQTGPMTMGSLDCDGPSTGVAYGLEVSLRRPLTERLGGWLAYTLSRATEATRDDAGTHTLFSPFDRRHVATATLAYQLTASWRVGARVTAYSGAPFIVPTSTDATSQIRLPWYERVDLRAERRWTMADRRTLALVIDVLDATLAREQDRVVCTPTCTVMAGNRFFVPSVGLEGSL